MTVITQQKIIRIGSSKGTTFPAKALKQLGVDVGDEVEITIRKKTDATSDDEIMKAAQSILTRYKQDFQNLAQR